MSNFIQDTCYETANGSAACIEFHQDQNHRRGFNVSQLIDYSLDPNPVLKRTGTSRRKNYPRVLNGRCRAPRLAARFPGQ